MSQDIQLTGASLPEGASTLWGSISVDGPIKLSSFVRQALLFDSSVKWQLGKVELDLTLEQVRTVACPCGA